MGVFDERDEAWAVEIYRRYAQGLLKYARSLLGDRAQAEDAVQSVVLMLLQRRSQLRAMPEGELKAYLVVSLRNLCFRMNGVGAPAQLNEALVADLSELPDELLLKRVRAEAVRREVGALSQEQRAVISMRYTLLMSHAEIARSLGISEGASRLMLHRTLARLKKNLAKEEGLLDE